MAWRTSEHLIFDEITGVQHFVTIDFPHRFEQLKNPPVIVCLDGAWMAGTVRDATRIMSMSGEAPEAVVVGVWFDDATMSAYLRSRACWYTPTAWVPPPETGVKGVTSDDTGKAAIYRQFISHRLLPFIDEQVETGERWLVGHSFSALFGLHTLFTEPGLFDAYLLASPSIWWDDRAILDTAQQWSDKRFDIPATVFMSAGENEGGDRFDDTTFLIKANVLELGESLRERKYPTLDLSWTVLAGETHNSTTSNAINKGIRSIYRRRTRAVERAEQLAAEHAAGNINQV